MAEAEANRARQDNLHVAVKGKRARQRKKIKQCEKVSATFQFQKYYFVRLGGGQNRKAGAGRDGVEKASP